MGKIKIKFFSSAVLKYIAMISMLIDHIAASGLIFLLFNIAVSMRLYYISRMIGRVAFPIYLFLLVEGFVHTKNTKKYIIRLTLFALMSEVPFDQNVMWSLLICVIMLCGMKMYPDFSVIFVGMGCFAAWFIKSDYEYIGPLAVGCMYLFRDRVVYKNFSTSIIFSF